ncbi:MAG: caa(3)-type oxidase subunit IV [Verrucomicrobia bacterium]|nr:caa(3)-type oxidase subunit IV [Verrucomicrobiota bacterium]
MNGNREAIEALGTYLALLALLLASIGFRWLHLGGWEPVGLLLIAAVQGALVILFFMRVSASSQLIWLFAGGGFLWIGIMIVMIISDYVSRPWWR